MGEALFAYLQTGWDLLTAKTHTPKAPTVGGHPVVYSALTNEQIAARAEGDELFETGNWVSVNRKA
ncbi:MAG TPA: hypothetical protein VFC54_08105 [Pseudolabrys sp.]|nr:hypothetical protein [Pseudolabrys sp.]